MIGDLKPYPEYKDSGTEWLGRIPEHWTVLCLKYALSRNDGGVWGEDFDDNGIPVLRSTDMTVDGRWNITDPARRILAEKEYNSAKLEEGDLVMTKSSGSALHLGKTALVSKEVAELNCCFANFMQRLRPKDSFGPHYLYYILNSSLGREQLNFWGSTTTGLANLNSSVIGSVVIPAPPLPEQRAIAAFLDEQTARLDAAVAEQRRLIELLGEKRTALISHAVTRGLDPQVPMKDSGIPSIGKIPAHWQVRRNKRIFEEINERSTTDDEELLTVSHITGITPRSEKQVYMFLAESLEGYKVCHPDDLVINTMWAWMGALGMTEYEGVVSPSYNVYRLRAVMSSQYHPKYLDFLYRIPEYVCEINRYSKGIWSSRLRLYPDYFFEMHTPSPPLEEQRAIAAHLDRETACIDAAVAEIERAIAHLEEYRAALIAAAVTGRIKVDGPA